MIDTVISEWLGLRGFLPLPSLCFSLASSLLNSMHNLFGYLLKWKAVFSYPEVLLSYEL